MKHIVIAACLAVLLAGPASARDLGPGALPIRIDTGAPFAFAADDELRIEGVVEAGSPVVVVLRVDDVQSWSYASRVNAERTLPPGSFRWTVAAKGLRASDGRTLDHTQLRRLMFFVGAGKGKVVLKRFETVPSAKLPGGAVGYALGAEKAELPAGFERVLVNDSRVSGANLFAVQRPSPDPLVASGIRGIEGLRLPWAGPKAHVTIWTEDPGEWELLPHPLERRIRINGRDVVAERMTPQDWIEQRYLRHINREHGPADDAWTAYGQLRGGMVSVEVDVVADGVVVELAGSSADALYLSAVLIEPAGQATGLDHVQGMRAEWYRSNWPVVKPESTGRLQTSVTLDGTGALLSGATVRAVAAPDTAAHVAVQIISNLAILKPQVMLVAPTANGIALTGFVWAAQQRLERRSAGDTVLALGDNLLSGATDALPIVAGVPRTYELWIDIPAATQPGLYHGALVVGVATIPIDVEVLPVTLPPARKPAGFYVDEAPHLTWFPGMGGDRDRQAGCDLAFLSRLKLNGSAPPLATPGSVSGAFEADMARAARSGMTPQWLAYAPAKRLLEQQGIDGSAATIARVERELQTAGLSAPLWSLADEPSNPGPNAPPLTDWIRAIRKQAPGAKLAAQLNTPKDRALISAFDTVLLNHGYGLDLATLADARARGADVWIYNTERTRATAGLWLWRSPATHYLQWHARMPTADPFDPTDGREGDVQAFLPTSYVCRAVPSVDRSMLDMADGVIDQRWFYWLVDQKTSEARALTEKLDATLPSKWAEAAALGGSNLQAIREAIVEVSRYVSRGAQ
jgi:hypothetical protein